MNEEKPAVITMSHERVATRRLDRDIFSMQNWGPATNELVEVEDECARAAVDGHASEDTRLNGDEPLVECRRHDRALVTELRVWQEIPRVLLAELTDLLRRGKSSVYVEHALNAVDLRGGDFGGEPDATRGHAPPPRTLDHLVPRPTRRIGVVEHDHATAGREYRIESWHQVGQGAAEGVAVEPFVAARLELARRRRLPGARHPHHEHDLAACVVGRPPLGAWNAEQPAGEAFIERDAVVLLERDRECARERRGTFDS